jgi:hypothetical protein
MEEAKKTYLSVRGNHLKNSIPVDTAARLGL